ncbi:MAG: glucodextranase DOMON-like domain-containing protein [bacterium]
MTKSENSRVKTRALGTLIIVLIIAGCAGGEVKVVEERAPRVEGGPPYRINLKDPIGDDKGTGSYTYPTNPVYVTGSFDLVEFDVEAVKDDVIFAITMYSEITNPFLMKEGFSLQLIDIYIDKDHTANSGFTDTIAGRHLRFPEREAWDVAVVIGPETFKIERELKSKSRQHVNKVLVAKNVEVRGKTIIARVKVSDIGYPQEGWGYQVISLCADGFPRRTDVRNNVVNAKASEWRFGGGDDSEGNTNALDVLMPDGRGTNAERDAQYDALKKYALGSDGKWKYATIPMLYPRVDLSQKPIMEKFKPGMVD